MKLGKFSLKWVMRYLSFQTWKNGRKAIYPDMSRAKVDIKPNEDSSFEQSYDIFYAEKPCGMTIIDIHGGAYIYSDRKNNQTFARYFLDRGFNFVTVDYRPNLGKLDVHDQVKDIASCIKHFFDHAEEYGIDPNRVALTGDSAGGHFALLLAEMACNPKVAEPFGIDLSGVRFLSVAVNCPVFDFVSLSHVSVLNKSGEIFILGKRFEDVEFQRLACPKAHFDSMLLPLFVSTCTNDFIRPHSLELHEHAKAINKEHIYLDINDDRKEIDHIHNVTKLHLPESIRVNDSMIEFFLANDAKNHSFE